MKKNYSFLAIIILLLTSGMNSNAQFLKHLSVGIDAGTYGGGISAATTITPNLLLKAGLGYTSTDVAMADMNFDVNGRTASHPAPDIAMNLDVNQLTLSFCNFKLGVEYYPMKNGIFSLGAGFYLGQSGLKLKGQIADYESITNQQGGQQPYFDFGDVVIQPKSNGTMTADVRFGNAIKPYFGIGLGRSIATNNRVGFKCDIGIVYQGKIKIGSDNAASALRPDTQAAAAEALGFLDSPLMQIWPMINFSLSYRIF